MTSGASNNTDELPDNAIAVIGMAGRFPGAGSVSEFWRNLRNGVESIVDLPEDELLANGVTERTLSNRSYVRRAGLMPGIDEFDADFFGFTPYAARMLDPQHRLFLQTVFHAMEDAGYDPKGLEATVGVFGTSSSSGYLLHNLMSNFDPMMVIGQGASFEMVNLSLQNDKDHLATRAAHQFDFRGPALSVATACSSSLVAVHLACQSLLNGECDIALAGGSSLRIPHHVGYWYEQGAMVSPTGQCRPFDVRSDGTIFASGVGVVVLKALADAIDDGDHIHAVIRGSALNNDGSTKMTYAAPNALGQAEVIAEAHAIAGVDASSITYVETHGTGTPLGDPIEIEGLRQAFELSEETRSAPCYLGSVKSNIGHLETAAGIAGLIKAILCLEHKAIPATLHYTSPNPELHLDRGPFRIRSSDGPWESDGIRRAGVSSFGVGGTNAHIVLEEAPTAPVPAPRSGPQVLVLSARTEETLAQSRAALAAELSEVDEISLPDAAYTLTHRRKDPVRLAAVVHDQENAATVLSAAETDNVFIGRAVPDLQDSAERVAFLFPGQGAQHVGMARGLYDNEPVFKRHFDECATAFSDDMGYDLRAEIFDGVGRNLEHTDRAQPALFTVEYALAKLVQSYGVEPAIMAGHSIGEYPAATIAGVFDLDTAVKVVSKRAKLMHAAPRGVMVAVPLSPEAVAEHLTPDVDVATINDPGSCVVAGSEEAIRTFQAALAEKGVAARRVRTSHAFHSRLMDPVVAEFGAFLSGVTLREPQIPLLSNITGTTMTAAEATNPSTWARQIRATVRFADELDALLAAPDRVLVEVGPGGTLTSSAGRHPKWTERHRAVRLMRHQAQNRNDHDTFLLALGQLWAADVEVDFNQGAEEDRTLITLPGYPFAKQRHWVEHNANAAWLAGGAGADGTAAAAGSAGVAPVAAGGTSTVEAKLARIWSQCLGLSDIDRNANFFEIGGDSLIAISVAMTAGHEGLDLTPQDLYENQTVAALAKVLTARYAEGGLARQTLDDAVNPPVPPNVAYFLEHGLRDIGRWRIPVILGLRSDVGEDDVRAVLTAVTEVHDALRVHLVERAGTWDQHIAEPGEFTELVARQLPEGLAAGSPQEREAVLGFLDEQVREHQVVVPLAATFIRGVTGGPSYLALSLHGIAGDDVSRDVLLTDVFTAFSQRMAGEEIVLAPVPASWREWSQRCAGLASHPAVLDSRDYWLQTAGASTLRIAGPEHSERPGVDDVTRLSTALSAAETGEIDDARRRLRLPVEEILLAALGRAVAATVGEGAVSVDLGGRGRSVLKPDVDLQRTVGWFTTIHPVVLTAARQGSATQALGDVRETLKAVPHYGIGYGLLRYLYAPTARVLGASRPADILFSHIGTIPEVPAEQPDDAPVRFDADTAMPIRDALPGLGHAVELRVYRAAGVLHLDWWYDNRRLGPTDVESFARQYSEALLDVTRDALAEEDTDAAGDELALVDLS
ncbi:MULTISPECIES: type I polyketide synthase [Mycolicibacterium]|uniref:Beta-ketoacyl synthase n=1 Tax=Mycolicibacterium vanbaalenii (strain DSM 7251 / JCM 13017 / BCRC 16820 / KCTC 9966 / NRRL B-24157 / PYR-1) TaxID=350058 RepID=A1T9S5_MYCVP|nr:MULTISPECIES: type I polyketide synthase [Mycolicibacterium]ABM13925.1 beta-ketoacyl synthase [Mycolicibacterium vanbaalenii PYR-1]MCV7129039.1 acyltransferase domain-containing protein [Mycolicibacterium vanbaalenii PYR-1]MDW5609949.1 beta-ketoacyl synthase N-terminal-like domain-containing protein [Mycolicibacterium sp. D5.8-2]